MSASGIEDYWTQKSDAQNLQPSVDLSVDAVSDIVPLDSQFGVTLPKTVPDAIFAPIFGPIEPEHASAEKRKLGTFALLDAAKVPALPELLEASELEHRCLFKGDAFDALKDTAPWLVRLDRKNAFTRNLFTRSDAPWHLWDQQPGLYIRSSASFDQLWHHFRKFTRIQDEAGKWFYFRFWESHCLTSYIRFAQDSESIDLRPLVGFDPDTPSLPLVRAYISTGLDEARICTVSRVSGHNTETRTKVDLSIVRFLALQAHAYQFVDSFFEGSDRQIGASHRRKARETATYIAQKYHGYGFKSRYHLGSFTYWALALDADFETRTQSIQDQVGRRDADPNERFVAIAREMKAMFGSKIRNYGGHGT